MVSSTVNTVDGTRTGQSGPGSNGNEVVLYIPQSFRTGPLPLDCLVLYLGHYLMGSYLLVEMHLAYSTCHS